jgi:hypothetical protein
MTPSVDFIMVIPSRGEYAGHDDNKIKKPLTNIKSHAP